MNPTLLLVSIAAAIIGSAQAGYVYIYSPFGGSHCKPGLPCPISWHVSHDGPEFSRVDIELLSGEAHNANVVAPVVLGYELSQGNTYIWNVPQISLSEGDYFIRIKGVGTDYESYSHTFPIGFEPQNTATDTITPTGTATNTETLIPTRTGSISLTSSTKQSSTAKLETSTSTSSAKSVQGAISVSAAIVAAALAVMMF